MTSCAPSPFNTSVQPIPSCRLLSRPGLILKLDTENSAIAALREGAQDYLVKGEIKDC